MLTVILQIVAAASWLACVYRKSLRNVHMLQLNSYRNGRMWNWYKNNVGRNLRWPDVLPVVPVVLLMLGNETWAYSVWIVLYLLLALTAPKEIEKKKLVYTARVKRLLATIAVVLAILVAVFAIWPPYGAALLFLATLFTAGVILLANTINKPIEQGINNGYLNDARRKIKTHANLQVIGITGSYGKTSVKHFLTTILGQHFNVLMTPESYNTPMGVTKTVRGQLQPTHDYFVCEMGAKQKGDIKEICDIVYPKYGIITAVGEQHLESFLSLDNIKKTKFELAEALPADGALFVNVDDENVVDQLKRANIRCRIVSYGVHNEEADYFGSNIEYSRNGATFTVRRRSDGETLTFQTALLGEHNIQNILAGIAVGDTLGVPLQKLAVSVKKIKPVTHRLELRRNGNFTILDDSFNSNPVGSKAALAVLAQMPEKKILITPGMIELGEKEYDYNYAFGAEAAKVCDYIVLVGPKQTKPMQDALAAAGYADFYVARNLQDALAKMRTLTTEPAVVLLENDLPDNYNE